MAYSTPAMVRAALAPSVDPSKQPDPKTNTAADLTDAQLNDAIAEADATIDATIGKFYAVPVAAVGTPAAVPHPIDYWSRNIAAYNAELSRRGSLDFADTDPVARRYKATMDALNMVAAGKVNLQLPDNVSTNAGVGAGAPVNPYVGDLFAVSDFDLAPSWSDRVWRGHWW